ncbi:hypothetical protein GVAV_003095 [Gurleya vavrai]
MKKYRILQKSEVKTEEHEKFNEKLNNLKSNVENLQSELKNKEDELEKCKIDNDRYKKECFTYTSKIKDLNEKINYFQNQINQLEEAKKKNFYNQELEKKIDEQFEEIKNLNYQLKNNDFSQNLTQKNNHQYNNNVLKEKENYLNKDNDNIYVLKLEILNLKKKESSLLQKIHFNENFQKNIIDRLKYYTNLILEITNTAKNLEEKFKINKIRTSTICKKYKAKYVYNLKKYKQEKNKNQQENFWSFLSSKNKGFIYKYFSNENLDINEMIERFAILFKNLNNKIDILEKENGQITTFVNNNSKQVNEKTLELLEKFNIEFKSAKTELDFCKDYLKKKGNEIKNLKKEIKIANEKLAENNIVKNNADNLKTCNENKGLLYGIFGTKR